MMRESMMKLGETSDVTVTFVVDNYADVFAASKPGVERYGSVGKPLLAEHGLSIHLRLGSERHEVLLDAGHTKVAVLHNLPLLEVEPKGVDEVVISHGHRDHTGSVVEFLQKRGGKTPVVVHPDAFLERWKVLPDGVRQGPWQESAEAWQQAGADIVYVEGPRQLANGCLATGAIPRRTGFERVSDQLFYSDGGKLVPDLMRDDQAIVVNVRGKGLVVITGCAHSGIVNTVLYAQEVSGVETVHAVMGGFHLCDASEETMQRSIQALKEVAPRLVMPAHCSGFEARRRFAAEMAEEFAPSAVGTTLKF
jgi:7,8-dihydropterin-6-yl-methyl-4-(beta-D-ribofuranosyl)aminobenzene 5'-phosphate synthase